MRTHLLIAAISLSTLGVAFQVRAADPPPKNSTAAKSAKAGDKILSPAQLKECLAQQSKLDQQDADAVKQKQSIEAEKSEIKRITDELAGQVSTLDKTNADAVNGYNEQVQARARRFDAFQASVDGYNAKVESMSADHEAFAKSCGNRRFLADDETAIKKGK